MKTQKGQSLLEFALVIPVLLFVVMAVIAFSELGYSWMEANKSAHAAAHAAAIHIVDGSEKSCYLRAMEAKGSPAFIGVENSTFSISPCNSDSEWVPPSGERVLAIWQFNFSPMLPFIYGNFNIPVTVRATDWFR